MKKLKILYQYSWTTNLNQDKGDYVNERNFIKALSSFADVHYARNKFDFNPKDFDIAYIRANEQMFDYCKGIKRIWMASPYNERCFREADYVATFTESWATVLREGETIAGVNPDGKKWNNVINVDQVLDNSFTGAVNPLTIAGYPVIGTFGRIVDSTFPHLLFASIPKLIKSYPDLKIVLGITKNRSNFTIPDYPCIFKTTFPHNEVPYVMAGCDIIAVNQKGIEWRICGNLKTVEAGAIGVPVVIANSRARRENLGEDYPFFLPIETFTPPITEDKIDLYVYTIDRILKFQKDHLNYIMDRTKKQAMYYSLRKSGKRLEKLFNSL